MLDFIHLFTAFPKILKPSLDIPHPSSSNQQIFSSLSPAAAECVDAVSILLVS